MCWSSDGLPPEKWSSLMYGLWPDGGLKNGKEATHCGRDRHQAAAVIDALSDLFILRGIPGHIRSDNGPEFVAMAVREWIAAVGAKTAYIERGSSWENGYCESFNSKLRDELLNGEIFYTLQEAK